MNALTQPHLVSNKWRQWLLVLQLFGGAACCFFYYYQHYGKPHDGCSEESTPISNPFLPLVYPAQSSRDTCEFYTFISGLSSRFAGVNWFSYDVMMAKEKYSHGNCCSIFICHPDDDCTRYWRWLHHFRWAIFDTHATSLLQTNAHLGCIIIVKCDTCQILGVRLYTVTNIVGNDGNRCSYFSIILSPTLNQFMNSLTPQNWNCSWVPNTVNVKEYMSFHSFILNQRSCVHKYEPSQPSPYQDSYLNKWGRITVSQQTCNWPIFQVVTPLSMF